MKRLTRPKSKRFREDPTQSKRIDDAYVKALNKILNHYQAAIEEEVKKSWPAVLGMREAEDSPISKLWKKITAAQANQIPPDEMETVAAEFSKKGYLQGIEFASTTLDQMGITLNIGMGPADKRALEILKSRNLTYLEGVTADLNSRIMTILTDGLSNGTTLQDIMKQLQDATDIARNKAERIARTEIMNAVNEAAKERYKQAGVEMVEWLTARDDRVCDICEPRDGKIYKLNELPDGGPPAHARCRCTTLAVLDE